jgi:hypothetical protein
MVRILLQRQRRLGVGDNVEKDAQTNSVGNGRFKAAS